MRIAIQRELTHEENNLNKYRLTLGFETMDEYLKKLHPNLEENMINRTDDLSIFD